MGKEFILLEGLEMFNRFFTTNDPNKSELEICSLENGEKAYRVIGYADSVQEAQIKLYGKTYD